MLLNHPANRFLRLVLEIVGLVSLIQWGWEQNNPGVRYTLAIGIPLIVISLWFVLNTPGDPGRLKQNAMVAIPGRTRLALEWLLFTLIVISLIVRAQYLLAGAIAFAVVLHYFWSIDRVVWLIRDRSKS